MPLATFRDLNPFPRPSGKCALSRRNNLTQVDIPRRRSLSLAGDASRGLTRNRQEREDSMLGNRSGDFDRSAVGTPPSCRTWGTNTSRSYFREEWRTKMKIKIVSAVAVCLLAGSSAVAQNTKIDDIEGAGTINYVPVFTGPHRIGNSTIFQAGATSGSEPKLLVGPRTLSAIEQLGRGDILRLQFGPRAALRTPGAAFMQWLVQGPAAPLP